MRRNLWIAILVGGVLALAGGAAADAPKDRPDASSDAAGLSAPHWGGGPHGHAMAAPECCGMGGHAGRDCGQACRHERVAGRGAGCGAGRGAGHSAGCGAGHSVGHGPQAGMAPGAGPRGGGGFEPGPGFGFGPGREAMGKLDLSEAQREKLADLRERTMKQNIQTGADLRIAQMDLHKLMRAETPDARAIEAQIDKVSGLRAAIQKARAAALLDARSVLTPEQQKKLRQMRGSMRPGMGRGPGGPHGMSGPGGPDPHGGAGGPSEGDDDI